MQWLLVRHVLSSTWFNKIIFVLLWIISLGFHVMLLSKECLFLDIGGPINPQKGVGCINKITNTSM